MKQVKLLVLSSVLLLIVGCSGSGSDAPVLNDGSNASDSAGATSNGSTSSGTTSEELTSAGSNTTGSSSAGLTSAGSTTTGDPLTGGSVDNGSLDNGSADNGSVDNGSVDNGSIDTGSMDEVASLIAPRDFTIAENPINTACFSDDPNCGVGLCWDNDVPRDCPRYFVYIPNTTCSRIGASPENIDNLSDINGRTGNVCAVNLKTENLDFEGFPPEINEVSNNEYSSFDFVDRCSDGLGNRVQLHSANSGLPTSLGWPGGDTSDRFFDDSFDTVNDGSVFSAGSNQTISIDLRCSAGDRICYGAAPQGRYTPAWGLGILGQQAAGTNSCFSCGMDPVINLGC